MSANSANGRMRRRAGRRCRAAAIPNSRSPRNQQSMAIGITKEPAFRNHSKGAKRADPEASWLAMAYPTIDSHKKAAAAEEIAPAPASRPGRASLERATTTP